MPRICLTEEEKRKRHAERERKYRREHKEEISNREKERRKEDKEGYRVYDKNNYERNKVKISEKKKRTRGDFKRKLQALEGRKENGEIARDNKITLTKRNIEIEKNNGNLFCEICQKSLVIKVKDCVLDIAEIHHKFPVEFRIKLELTTLDDLVVLCPNCHAAIRAIYMEAGNIFVPHETILKLFSPAAFQSATKFFS